MSLWEWIFGRVAQAAPDPASDVLGAATLPAPALIPVSAIGDLPSLSEAAIALVKKWEGFCAAPYLCPAGIPTIGYGATFYLDGRKVTLADKPISEADAAALLRKMASKFAADVLGMVKVPLSANELGALTSFAYNLGADALRDSTLLEKLNASDRTGAAAEFGKWVKAGGRTLPGLVSRRADEAAMFRA
ncbi:MAG: lysozyme [Rubritepida sp.]|nr:lysozyme [Rubritepida sp.]